MDWRKWKKNKNGSPADPLTVAGNLLLAAGAGIGLFALARSFIFSGALAAGTCPLTLNRPWLFASIACLVGSLVLSFFESGKKTRSVRQKDETSL